MRGWLDGFGGEARSNGSESGESGEAEGEDVCVDFHVFVCVLFESGAHFVGASMIFGSRLVAKVAGEMDGLAEGFALAEFLCGAEVYGADDLFGFDVNDCD